LSFIFYIHNDNDGGKALNKEAEPCLSGLALDEIDNNQELSSA
jgi:hypothetical protein